MMKNESLRAELAVSVAILSRPERRETSSANPNVTGNQGGTCPDTIRLPWQIVRVSQQSWS